VEGGTCNKWYSRLNIKEDVAATFYMFAEWGKKKSKEKEKNEV
jgi:hypothetical protein